MSEENIIIAIAGAVVAIIIGFLIGRVTSEPKKNVAALEAEITRQKDEIASYKREVEGHFDKTASLFVSMAGSYKDLFEHLSADYEKLSDGSARELFRERVDALLLGAAATDSAMLTHDDTAPATDTAPTAEAGEADAQADDAQADDAPADDAPADDRTAADAAAPAAQAPLEDSAAERGEASDAPAAESDAPPPESAAAPTEDDVVPNAPSNTPAA